MSPGCSSRFDDGRAFLSEPSSRSPAAPPTSTPNTSETPVVAAKAIVIRGGIGTGQPVGSGQLPVLVYLDPGHGGVDVGTQGSTVDGKNVFEKSVSLAIAIRAQ